MIFYLNNIKIIASDAGVTAVHNGGTHMSFEDMGIMRGLADTVVMEMTDAAMGLRVKREVWVDSTRLADTKVLKIGDKVRIRLTIIADRDYDFVQVIDKRAACLEPVSQLSGYHWGYYIAQKDYTTNYYFDRMAKGKHVVETEYYIDRAGVYQTGTCTVQCAYAPEYGGRTGALQLTVGK